MSAQVLEVNSDVISSHHSDEQPEDPNLIKVPPKLSEPKVQEQKPQEPIVEP